MPIVGAYRPEIDGLRCLAVLPVIAFHAGAPFLTGGYAGVDVFFVISGYLITGILLRDLEDRKFSIYGFYERRARRILPALFTVLLACIPFAWLWMTPDQLESFAGSILSVIGFVSNHFFWSETGYFDGASELKPLLHTWSLAVEEQFYLFFPPFLWLVWRFGKLPAFRIICGLSLASLALCLIGIGRRPDMTFFLLPFRAWELGVGAMCAFVSAELPRSWTRLLGWLGLAMILTSMVVFDSNTPWPSLATLLPVTGTALIVMYCRHDLGAGIVLAARPFVAVGLISYSAYLWHQPIFAFARIRSLDDPSPWVMAALVCLTLLLSFITWKYVEQPFRRGSAPTLPRRGQVFIASAAMMAALGVFGGLVLWADGVTGRLTAEELALAEETKIFESACLSINRSELSDDPKESCLAGPRGDPSVVIAGDSHAAPIASVLQEHLAEMGVASYTWSFAGCVPVPALHRLAFENHTGCIEYNKRIRSYLEELDNPILVLSARWQAYLQEEMFDNGEGGIETGRGFTVDRSEGTVDGLVTIGRKERVLNAYREELIELLDKYRVVLIYPIPEAGWNVPLRAFKLTRFEGEENLDISTDFGTYTERSSDVSNLFDEMEHPNLYRVRPDEFLCNKTRRARCDNVIDGNLLYADDDHLSPAGASLLMNRILSELEAALQDRLALAK